MGAPVDGQLGNLGSVVLVLVAEILVIRWTFVFCYY